MLVKDSFHVAAALAIQTVENYLCVKDVLQYDAMLVEQGG